MRDRSEYFGQSNALLTAALVGDLEAGKLLLEQGADPNQQDELGRTPLMIAIQEGWGSSIWGELLIEFDANINLVDQDGDSALDLAVFHQQNEMVAFLQGKGALGKTGPSAKQLQDDAIYRAFDDADAVKRLVSMTNEKKTR